MKICIKTLIIAGGVLAFAGTVRAGESAAGKWIAQFDSQIGVQKYTYDFKVNGDKLTGTATGERQTGTNIVTITEGKINKDEITFVEPLKFGDNELRIEYTGKVVGNEIKFHRKVGDVAQEDFVARRVKESGTGVEPKPMTKADTNSPPARP